MAAVKQDFDYNFGLFDTPVRASRASTARASTARAGAVRAGAAPQRRVQPREPLKVVPKRTPKERLAQYRRSTGLIVFILSFAVVILAMLSLQINAGAKIYEISRQISAVEAQIEQAKSEQVRLNYELDGITSIGNIDDYATRILGMSKVESYQVEYIDLGRDDGVLYCSDGGFLGIFSNH